MPPIFCLATKSSISAQRFAYIAAVAAESEEIAQHALDLIEVEYELLPAYFDPHEAMKPETVKLHDEPESWRIEDKERNLASEVDWELGNCEEAFKTADYVFEDTYYSPKVQQTPIEPHVVVTWFDENDRLIIRTSRPANIGRLSETLKGMPVVKEFRLHPTTD